MKIRTIAGVLAALLMNGWAVVPATAGNYQCTVNCQKGTIKITVNASSAKQAEIITGSDSQTNKMCLQAGLGSRKSQYAYCR